MRSGEELATATPSAAQLPGLSAELDEIAALPLEERAARFGDLQQRLTEALDADLREDADLLGDDGADEGADLREHAEHLEQSEAPRGHGAGSGDAESSGNSRPNDHAAHD